MKLANGIAARHMVVRWDTHAIIVDDLFADYRAFIFVENSYYVRDELLLTHLLITYILTVNIKFKIY